MLALIMVWDGIIFENRTVNGTIFNFLGGPCTTKKKKRGISRERGKERGRKEGGRD